ncbi:hypothetical protein Tco_0648710, partial [Tanacetum coccineum]
DHKKLYDKAVGAIAAALDDPVCRFKFRAHVYTVLKILKAIRLSKSSLGVGCEGATKGCSRAGDVIMEYLVKISKKARILELKTKTFKDYCSNILYAVSIKEDTSYLCLHFTRNHEDVKSNTPYPGDIYKLYSI